MTVTVNWGPRITDAKYTVPGADLESADKFISGREEAGSFDYDFPASSFKRDSGGNVTSFTFTPSFKLTMPTWPAYRKQPQECKDAWDDMWRAVEKHELEHRRIFEQGFAKLVRELEQTPHMPFEDLKTSLCKAKAALQKQHDDFDTETDHGRSRGSELIIPEKCKAKQKN